MMTSDVLFFFLENGLLHQNSHRPSPPLSPVSSSFTPGRSSLSVRLPRAYPAVAPFITSQTFSPLFPLILLFISFSSASFDGSHRGGYCGQTPSSQLLRSSWFCAVANDPKGSLTRDDCFIRDDHEGEREGETSFCFK